jgi:hypothetical protein
MESKLRGETWRGKNNSPSYGKMKLKLRRSLFWPKIKQNHTSVLPYSGYEFHEAIFPLSNLSTPYKNFLYTFVRMEFVPCLLVVLMSAHILVLHAQCTHICT